MTKDKKKKKDGKKAPKPGNPGTLKSLAQNPLVADVVAAALVATASALKDSDKARRLASEAGDELAKMSKAGSQRGNALWEMALQIGRRSIDALAAGDAPKPKKIAKPKSKSGSKARTAKPGKARKLAAKKR